MLCHDSVVQSNSSRLEISNWSNPSCTIIRFATNVVRAAFIPSCRHLKAVRLASLCHWL